MKRVLRYIAFLAATVLALSSCVVENEPGSGEGDASVSLVLKLPYTTRAISPEPGDESQISTVDVLAFTQVNGEWVYDYQLKNITKKVEGNDMTITGTARSKESAQVFVILVNASSQLADANPVRNEKMSVIENRIVASAGGAGEWPARINGTGTFTPFPMYGRTDARVVGPAANTIGDPTPYPIIRMVARIDVTLKSDIDNFVLEEACLFNYKTAGYVSYGNSDFNTTAKAATTPAVPASGDHTGDPVKEPTVYYSSDKAVDSRGVIQYSIYTFESPAIITEAGKTTGTALVIGGYYGNQTTKKTYYRIDLKTTDDASSRISSGILRNHSYAVEIQSVGAEGDDRAIDAYLGGARLTAEVVAWNDTSQNVIGDKQYSLTVSEDDFIFSHTGDNATLTAKTDYNRTDEGFPAGIQFKQSEVTYGSDSGWITIGGATGSLMSTISLSATANTGNTARTAKIYVRAGNFTKVINVTQMPTVTGPGTQIGSPSYVGAFWRAEQTGERLISISATNGGTFAVAVYDYGDHFQQGDIVFSAMGSDDSGVGTSPADAEGYKIIDGTTSIKSTVGSVADGKLFFRIGLTSKWDASNPYYDANHPVRYATILIAYTSGSTTIYQKLFLRQGEEADYLMHPDDVTDATQKTYVRRYSSYNVTAATMSDSEDHVQIYKYGTTANGTVASSFTEYPSQAGAMFQWAGAAGYQRLAWHPTKTYTGWSGNIYDNSPTWDAATHETCPSVRGVNYRRPTADGAVFAKSEFGLSLFKPVTYGTVSNALWGYYADGFFDRRAVSSASVESSSYRAAYAGMLFYNPVATSPRRNASVFLPGAGIRDYSSGALILAGTTGYFWASIPNGSTAYLQGFSNTYFFTDFANDYRSYAAPLRCVVDDSEPEPTPVSERMARSNVVVIDDGNGGKILTFAETAAANTGTTTAGTSGVTRPAMPSDVQGVFFKFGSLVALYAYDLNWSADQVVYNPTAATYSSHAEVPFFDVTGLGSVTTYDAFTDPTTGYGSTGYSLTAGKGDICRYISDKKWVEGRWRIPTMDEYYTLCDETYASTAGDPISLGNFSGTRPGSGVSDYGLYSFGCGVLMGEGVTSDDSDSNMTSPGSTRVFLPAPGFINTGGYYYNFFGTSAYWSSSTYGDDNAWSFNFDGYIRDSWNEQERSYAQPIRCIRDE